ncbi:hypothetical protein AKUG0402_12450 [Apilactobacillus kunkeei]|nr:hypothetical protein AKUG0402_12450 [Apilactobacillus kunkeei]
MFLNIRARFLFETRFYERRQAGVLTANDINDLMSKLKRMLTVITIYLLTSLLGSKMHFYIDDIPFYNFPYTFGYLFSLGIYAKAQATDDFEDQYISLLRDTAK